MLEQKKYCASCGSTLNQIAHGVKSCNDPACGINYYDNPIIGVAGIYIKDNKILLGRRSGTHKNGKWCIPCGYLENENIEDGLIREFQEETALTPTYVDLYYAQSNHDNPNVLTVGIYYVVTNCTGELAAADDLDTVRFFNYHELESIELAFESDRAVIAKLKAEEDLM